MQQKEVHFFSVRNRLSGAWYLPEGEAPPEGWPVLIVLSGYQGLRDFYPKRFGEAFCEHGFAVFGFDYRGFGKSEGDVTKVHVDAQLEDTRCALNFVLGQSDVPVSSVGIIGWGMGAAYSVLVAAEDQRVVAVGAFNGFFQGERWLRSVHSYINYQKLRQLILDDRAARAQTGEISYTDPFAHYPLDYTTHHHVSSELESMHGDWKQVHLAFIESVLRLNVDRLAPVISPRPVFVAHGRKNWLHPPEESFALFEALQQPKAWHWIEGSHNDFMYSDNPEFKKLVNASAQYLKEYFT